MPFISKKRLSRAVNERVDFITEALVLDTVNDVVMAVTDVSWGFGSVSQTLDKLRDNRFGPRISDSALNNIRYMLVDLDTRLKGRQTQ